MRISRITEAVPVTAPANRHPNGVGPKIHSPAAIMYLPTIGWTTPSGVFVRPLRSPCAKAWFSPFHLPPYPSSRSEYDSRA